MSSVTRPMQLRLLSDARRGYPDFQPNLRRGDGDILVDNEPFNRDYHVAVCNSEGAPLYDMPARSERRGAVAIPVDRHKRIALIEQWRPVPAASPRHNSHPLRDTESHGYMSPEVPRGFREGNETSADTARRETQEEIGLMVTRMRPLGWCNFNTTYMLTDFPIYAVFVEADKPAKSEKDANEHIEGLSWWTFSELRTKISRGDVRCGITLACLSYVFASDETLTSLVLEGISPDLLKGHMRSIHEVVEEMALQMWELGVCTSGLELSNIIYVAESQKEHLNLQKLFGREKQACHREDDVVISGNVCSTFRLRTPALASGFLVRRFCVAQGWTHNKKGMLDSTESRSRSICVVLKSEKPLASLLEWDAQSDWVTKNLGTNEETAELKSRRTWVRICRQQSQLK